jgi:uncharacterized membrane protein YqjE
MIQTNPQAPGISTLLGRIGHTLLGSLQNRGELLVVEWQEEKSRLLAVILWAVGGLCAAVIGLVLATGLIIFLFPADSRMYVAGGFALLYLGVGVGSYFALKSRLSQEPFSETIRQVRKDAAVLEALNEGA